MMNKLPIFAVPAEILRVPAEDVGEVTPDIVELAERMASTMYASSGCGLAAPQIGVSRRLVVIDCSPEHDGGEGLLYLVDPVVSASSDSVVADYEGCLSVPGVMLSVSRPDEVEFEYTGIDGKRRKMSAGGLLARCVQHEVDHLDGKTMLDAVRGLEKMQALSAYSAARKRGIEPGDEPVYYVGKPRRDVSAEKGESAL